jgi:type I restriction enzyme, S subunit
VTPTMRFPDFEGQLPEHQLGDIATFRKGKGVSKADVVEDGQTPCVRYGELYTRYGQVIDEPVSKTNLPDAELLFSQANDVVIPASGETPLDIATAACVLRDGIALGGDLNIIRGTANGLFLAYYLSNKKKRAIARLGQGNSVVHLYGSHLAGLKLRVPSAPEQQKIADFLVNVDERIKLLQQRRDAVQRYKQGIMQRIFSQSTRFKRDDGSDFPDWEECTLGDLLAYEQPTQYLVSSTDYDDTYLTPVLTAGKTFILGYTNETHGIYQKNLPVIIFDDFTTASKFVDFPFKAKSSAMKILRKKRKDDRISLIFDVLQSIKYVSSDHMRHWISEFQDLTVMYPQTEEQQKIADFLSALDGKIAAVAAQVDQAQAFKKGLLQQMFV